MNTVLRDALLIILVLLIYALAISSHIDHLKEVVSGEVQGD